MKTIRGQSYTGSILLTLLFLGLVPTHAGAASLAIDPAIQSQLRARFPLTAHITFSNKTDQTTHISMHLQEITQEENGHVRILALQPACAHISSSHLTLLPQENISVPVEVNHDCYFTLLSVSNDISENQNASASKTTSQTNALVYQQGVLAPLFLYAGNSSAPSVNALSIHAPMYVLGTSFTPTIQEENASGGLVHLKIQTSLTTLLQQDSQHQSITNAYILPHVQRTISTSAFSVPFPYIGPAWIHVFTEDALTHTTHTYTLLIILLPIQTMLETLIGIGCIVFVVQRVKKQLYRSLFS